MIKLELSFRATREYIDFSLIILTFRVHVKAYGAVMRTMRLLRFTKGTMRNNIQT